MPRVQCSYCGLPFTVRKVVAGEPLYCCSGCALASRLPPAGEGGQFPVTRTVVAAVIIGFAAFNEVLFWTLALALAHQEKVKQAWLFGRVSAALGVLVWLAMATAIARAPGRRWSDAVVGTAALAAVVAAFWPPVSLGGLVAANAVLALWLSRGWCKQKFFRGKSIPV